MGDETTTTTTALNWNVLPDGRAYHARTGHDGGDERYTLTLADDGGYTRWLVHRHTGFLESHTRVLLGSVGTDSWHSVAPIEAAKDLAERYEVAVPCRHCGERVSVTTTTTATTHGRGRCVGVFS